jgi:DNA-binding transcriptional LysR family regulator
MDQLQAIRIFSLVAETGSFSLAARRLGLTQPTASKQVMALEHHLGAKLLHRNGRSIKLTDSGCDYYKTAGKVAADLSDADNRVRRRFASPVGSLRLVVPSAFSRAQMMSLISTFLSHHPELSIEFAVAEQSLELIDLGFDLAIQIGELADSPHIARKICSTRQATVASVSYLERRGAPKSICELSEHECIPHTSNSGPANWAFLGPDGQTEISPQGRLCVSNSEDLRHAVLAGIGLAQPLALLFGPELNQGVVKSVLDQYEVDPVPVHVVYPEALRRSAKITRLVDFLAKEVPRFVAA